MMIMAMHLQPAGSGSDDSLRKVTVELPAAAWHGHATESLWAEPIATNVFKLQNVPFYAKGVSFGDVVRARPERHLWIVEIVLERSGHSTYRVVCDPPVFERRWPSLSALGCTYERADARLVAVDVPAQSNIWAVYRSLEDGERTGEWDFEEGHCGHRP